METEENDASEDEAWFLVLPEEILMKILSLLSYSDIHSSQLVCRRWNVLSKAITKQKCQIFLQSLDTGLFDWTLHRDRSDNIMKVVPPGPRDVKTHVRVSQSAPGIPCPRFSHGAAIVGKYMYIFGGSSTEQTMSSAYNDLYRLDLSTRKWYKVHTDGLLPAPREATSFLVHGKQIIMYGGWCQPRKMNVMPRFFDDTQIFDTVELKWYRVPTKGDTSYPPPRAGHACSMVGDNMVLFGGSHKNTRMNDVWLFNVNTQKWTCPYIRSKVKPEPRFGHIQCTLEDRFVVVIGGSGGPPNELFGDVWLLDSKYWTWSEAKVENQLSEPPDIWCHPGLNFGSKILIFSEEKKCPYCKCPIENNNIPTSKPVTDSTVCACGRDQADVVNLSSHGTTLQMYVLDCSELISHHRCKWLGYNYADKTPRARRLFTACLGMNEIVIFGGVQNLSQQQNRLDDFTIILSPSADRD